MNNFFDKYLCGILGTFMLIGFAIPISLAIWRNHKLSKGMDDPKYGQYVFEVRRAEYYYDKDKEHATMETVKECMRYYADLMGRVEHAIPSTAIAIIDEGIKFYKEKHAYKIIEELTALKQLIARRGEYYCPEEEEYATVQNIRECKNYYDNMLDELKGIQASDANAKSEKMNIIDRGISFYSNKHAYVAVKRLNELKCMVGIL